MNDAPLESQSDDDLVRLGRAGSEAALVELYDRYRPRVVRFALRMTGDRDLAEEVFCATFTAFFASIDRYRPAGRLAAYLFQIARSKLATELASRGRLGVPIPPGDDSRCRSLCDPAVAPDVAASEAELSGLARRALAALPVSLREVVVLRLFEGLDYDAIGAVTGTGAATARSRMRYALQELRQSFAFTPDADP